MRPGSQSPRPSPSCRYSIVPAGLGGVDARRAPRGRPRRGAPARRGTGHPLAEPRARVVEQVVDEPAHPRSAPATRTSARRCRSGSSASRRTSEAEAEIAVSGVRRSWPTMPRRCAWTSCERRRSVTSRRCAERPPRAGTRAPPTSARPAPPPRTSRARARAAARRSSSAGAPSASHGQRSHSDAPRTASRVAPSSCLERVVHVDEPPARVDREEGVGDRLQDRRAAGDQASRDRFSSSNCLRRSWAPHARAHHLEAARASRRSRRPRRSPPR